MGIFAACLAVAASAPAAEPPADAAEFVLAAGGDLADRSVVVGVSARVIGDVTSNHGGVRIVRLARVEGDVYSEREFRGDRDVVVGSLGSRVEVRGAARLRDRSEYFAAIVHEGPLELLGRGAPVFHAGVTAVSPGTIVAPGMPDWTLSGPAVDAADHGTLDVVVDKDDGAVTLARYGTA